MHRRTWCWRDGEVLAVRRTATPSEWDRRIVAHISEDGGSCGATSVPCRGPVTGIHLAASGRRAVS